MEFVTGYRDPILDFSELLFSWYQKYLTDLDPRKGPSVEARRRELELSLARLPMDKAPWVLHILRNHSLSFRVRNPEQQLLEHFYSEEALRLQDLDKFITLVSPTGEEEQEEDENSEEAAEEDLFQLDYFLLVTDEAGTIMGIDFLLKCSCSGSRQRVLARRAYNLLCHSMAYPMSGGKPRRPRHLTVGDICVHGILEEMLARVGVKVSRSVMRAWSPKQNFSFPSMMAKACHVCNRHSFQSQLTPCEKCKAVLYCSQHCRKMDWKKTPEDVSHQYWCEKMVTYMNRAKELSDLPFSYTAEVTSDTFDKESFLSERGLTVGYWAKESMNEAGALRAQDKRSWYPKVKTDPYDPLKKEGKILLQNFPAETTCAKVPFTSWKQYYQWRGFDMDSPIAALLTYPLTTYHIITHLVPQHFPELNILNKLSLKIHIIEPCKEFDLVMVFWELAVLLPHVTFELHFIGNDLQQAEDEQHFILQRKNSQVIRAKPSFNMKEKSDRKSIQVKAYSRAYHMLQGPKPDLVIGFNAGFGLKDTWLSSLPRLQSLRVPAYFTECSEYSCAIDGQIASMATGGSVSPAAVNPFRSPLRIIGIDNCMPWYPNAFVFHLIYKCMVGGSRYQSQQPHQYVAASATEEVLAEPRRRKKEKKQKRSNCHRRK
ncbi:zinc finger MYND domain-containing protein 15 [Rhinatrema bivittatum]|uniref:zinc finger MYND domain-containing protein 15 n=1 Tax=Rhinatrema bivittatum TaxID=194408 RepID=UPI00112E24CC|nr:zinc finger MYND domain-containing protein 15 [Rhinatrema bivittatum]